MRMEDLRNRESPCILCPRQCKVQRNTGQIGYCGIGMLPRISSAGPHFGEESVLVGTRGSGTIFFAGCNLGCVFCQNYSISHERQGRDLPVGQLAQIMMSLQEQGCHNINLVSPTHSIVPIAKAILQARDCGLVIPTVYNTGGYDSVETLQLLKGLIDIYMPDMKYGMESASVTYSGAPDYPRINQAAVREMHRQVGDLQIVKGIAVRGLLVRHLVLPNRQAGSRQIIDFLVQSVSPNTAVNIMDQYHPCYRSREFPQIRRRPTREEIDEVLDYAGEKDLHVLDQ
ncbi:MAG: radical SAM protein [Sedimentisphaerales bacterium]|nr:radical SAM protein [Sedimentisphaerales bacterium]